MDERTRKLMEDMRASPQRQGIAVEETRARKRRKEPLPKGHAWTPGTGPEGETCKGCVHYTIRQFAGRYRKCGKNRAAWTNGPGSDIRAKDPACKFWERRESAPAKG